MRITKDQVRELKDLAVDGGEISELLTKWYPDFSDEYMNNKWYTLPGTEMVIYVTDWKNKIAYGSNKVGKWYDEGAHFGFTGLVLASSNTVASMLIKQSSYRGYAKGNFECLSYRDVYLGCGLTQVYSDIDNELWLTSGMVFSNGRWAERINTISRSEAEKLFNIKILD